MKGITNATSKATEVVQNTSKIEIGGTSLQVASDSQPGIMSAADHTTLSTTATRIGTCEETVKSSFVDASYADEVITFTKGDGSKKEVDIPITLALGSVTFTPYLEGATLKIVRVKDSKVLYDGNMVETSIPTGMGTVTYTVKHLGVTSSKSITVSGDTVETLDSAVLTKHSLAVSWTVAGTTISDNTCKVLKNNSYTVKSYFGDWAEGYGMYATASFTPTANLTISYANTDPLYIDTATTVTVPFSGTFNVVAVSGGGGGGGGGGCMQAKLVDYSWSRSGNGGDGGGGGNVKLSTQALTKGTTYAITIGSGGSGGNGGTGNSTYDSTSSWKGGTGNNGGTTRFGTLVSSYVQNRGYGNTYYTICTDYIGDDSTSSATEKGYLGPGGDGGNGGRSYYDGSFESNGGTHGYAECNKQYEATRDGSDWEITTWSTSYSATAAKKGVTVTNITWLSNVSRSGNGGNYSNGAGGYGGEGGYGVGTTYGKGGTGGRGGTYNATSPNNGSNGSAGNAGVVVIRGVWS